MILTSNLPFTQCAGAVADDQVLAAAMLNRLQDHGHVVQISRESWRQCDKRRAAHLPH